MALARDEIIEALSEILGDATEAQLANLSDAIERYASKYDRTWKDLNRGNTMVAELLETLVEFSCARV
jgi:hypothetical protein